MQSKTICKTKQKYFRIISSEDRFKIPSLQMSDRRFQWCSKFRCILLNEENYYVEHFNGLLWRPNNIEYLLL